VKIIEGLKKLYKGLSWYNRQKLIEANRPFGKKKLKPKKK
jgi:hypothetical protein